jgi:hypothetical protein
MTTLKRSSGSLIGLVALLATATPSAAQIVHNNGAPNGQAGFDIFNDFRAADDFTVTGSLGFDLIRFWGLLPAGSTYAPTIFWQILTDAGGVPGSSAVASGSVLAQSTLRTALPVGFDSWQFDLAIGPQILGPGIFWLALHDGAIGDITDSSLLWEVTGSQIGSQFAVDFIPANDWTGNWGGDLAFQLESTPQITATPEPATMALVGTGLFGLAAARRRRRKASP